MPQPTDLSDFRSGGLYDRVFLRAHLPTPPEISFFQRGLSQSEMWTGDKFPWSNTNMLSPGVLMAPYAAIIQRFLFLFQPVCADSDVALLLGNYRWEFSVLEKRANEGPLLQCSVSGLMTKLVEDFGNAYACGAIRTFARQYSYLLGEMSAIFLPSLVPFRMTLRGTPVTPQQDLDFYAILDGSMKRPIS